MRVLGKGRNAALKLFAILNLGKSVRHETQAKDTEKLVETSSEVTDSNMETAAKEVPSISNINSDIKSTGVSFDCTWNSREWKAKEGVVASIAQKTGKIINILRKTTYCIDCKRKQQLRDDNEMTALEYMEWFINHNCYLNHTGSPQVGIIFLTSFSTCQSQLWG